MVRKYANSGIIGIAIVQINFTKIQSGLNLVRFSSVRYRPTLIASQAAFTL